MAQVSDAGGRARRGQRERREVGLASRVRRSRKRPKLVRGGSQVADAEDSAVCRRCRVGEPSDPGGPCLLLVALGDRGCAGAEGPIGLAGPQEGAQVWLRDGIGTGAGHHASPEWEWEQRGYVVGFRC